MRAASYARPPKTNPKCPARHHGTMSAHKAPPVGMKCECVEALTAYRDSEAAREAKRSGRPVRAKASSIPGTPPPPAFRVPEPADDPEWARDAACRGEDPELFFPVGDGPIALAQTAQAKAVCRVCPARRPCLERAAAIGADGVWGGTTEDERRAMRRAREHVA